MSAGMKQMDVEQGRDLYNNIERQERSCYTSRFIRTYLHTNILHSTK
jgi:hypothetical protein